MIGPCFDTVGDSTLGDVVVHHGATRPDHACVICEDIEGRVAELGYGEFNCLTNSVAQSLLASGLMPGDRILMMLPNGIPFVVTMLACAKAGLIAVPVNTGYVAPEVRHVVDLVEPTAFVADIRFIETVLEASPRSGLYLQCVVGEGDCRIEDHDLSTWKDLVAGPPDPPPIRVSADDVVQLIMTSGTTARPKAVARTHANCLWSAYRFAMQARLNPADRNLTALPGFHVNCLDQTLFSSLVSGATAILLERYSATRFMEQVRMHRATVISLVPLLIRTILAQVPTREDRDHDVRLAIGGLQITREELKEFEERFGLGVPILGGYGLTEASTNVTLTVLGGDPHWPSIGLPAIDRIIMLVDEEGIPVPVGSPGEVIVQGVPGRNLMKGYWRDEEATAAALRDGWLYTGDIARCDEDGYIYFVDRKKDMIKVAGENVAALEVEHVILENPAVREVAVIGVPDRLRDEAVKAVIVLADGARLDLEKLRVYCEPRLARFKIPTELEIVDDLPRAAIGKVDKGLLRERERLRGSVAGG